MDSLLFICRATSNPGRHPSDRMARRSAPYGCAFTGSAAPEVHPDASGQQHQQAARRELHITASTNKRSRTLHGARTSRELPDRTALRIWRRVLPTAVTTLTVTPCITGASWPLNGFQLIYYIPYTLVFPLNTDGSVPGAVAAISIPWRYQYHLHYV